MVYLDNAATTKPLDFVNTEWGNPNSGHGFGVAVYNEMRQARDRIKAAIGAKGGRVIFGYNATHLMEQICKHSVSYVHCSPYEHSSVTNFMKAIPTLRNFEDINIHQNIWNEDCFEWMMVNNLSGTIYDVERIGVVVKERGGYFITDATAAIGHIPIPPHIDRWCDCLIASAHKHHGPTGVGWMWVSDKYAKNILKLDVSPKDEYQMVFGTPNYSGVMLTTKAVEYACNSKQIESAKTLWLNLTNYLVHLLWKEGIEAKVVYQQNEMTKGKTYAINLIKLPGLNADGVVQYCSSKEIYIAPAHSACADSGDYSQAKALGLSEEEAAHCIRVSYSDANWEQDIVELANAIIAYRNLMGV